MNATHNTSDEKTIFKDANPDDRGVVSGEKGPVCGFFRGITFPSTATE
jgi:hypothetical protein